MNQPLTVDLNCDLGESFGAYCLGNDEAILPFVTSANIACGFHAGDPGVMKRTVQLAIAKGVALGAHPGLPDLVGFGRREMAVSPEEVFDLMVYQIGALSAFATVAGGRLHHVKPHGALYNMAAVTPDLAQAIAEAIYQVDPSLVLYGLAESELVTAGRARGLKTAQEVFADRTYQANGTLTPRSQPNALLQNSDAAVKQVVRMVKEGKVMAITGEEVFITADTVCLHGDGPHALSFAQKIREGLAAEGIQVRACH